MNNNRQRKLGALLSYISIFASTLVQLLYTPFLIRMLGQSEYGLYSLIASIIGYLTVLDLGFGNAIIVYTAKYRAQGKIDEEKKLHGMFKIVFYVIGIIAFLLGIVLYFNVNSLFGNTMTSVELEKAKIMMLILSFNLFVTFTFSIYQSIITASEKFVFQKIMSILNTILKPLMMIPLLFLGYKSITMTIVITIVNCMILLSNYIYCRKKLNTKVKYSGFDRALFKVILGYSIWLFLGAVVDKVNWSVDQAILGMVSGTVAVSLYSVAATLNQLFINLSTAISGVMLPKVTKMVANNASSKELTNEMIKVGRIQFYVIFLMVTGLILFGKEFIIWWVGKDFEGAYYVALWLIIPISFPLIQNIGLSIMQAMNKYKFKAISTAIMAIINIFISYFLAKQFGPLGCAMGTGLALIVCNIFIINIYYYKEIKLDVISFWKDIISMMIKYIPAIIIVLLIMYFTNISGLLSVIVYGGIYVIFFITTSYLIVMNDYEKELINKILRKFKLCR
ncbi:MAG: oligosaccharide flippase family protein [Bacilli bacterium]|nr:oligosaccharide flippase family protein [Bacilli bacterium]